MNAIPKNFIDDLINKTDIVSLIESHVSLKKMGASYKACCPFHQEKTPSFNVSPVKQLYHCFGCGRGGNALSFLMEYEHLNFIEAVEVLAKKQGLTVPQSTRLGKKEMMDDKSRLYEVLNEAIGFYQKQLREHPQKQEAIAYLKSRGLSGAIAKRFIIGYAPSGWNVLTEFLLKTQDKKDGLESGLLVKNEKQHYYDRFRNRIIFPIRDYRGRFIGIGGRTIDPHDEPKYLNSPETPIFKKRTCLYGLYEVLQCHRHLEKVILVEGYMDVIALAEHGIDYAVATLGTATTVDQIHLLLRYTEQIIFCFDGDSAGQKAARKALEVVLPILKDNLKISFLFLPQTEDPDSCVRQEGKLAFEKRMADALPLSQYLFYSLKSEIDLHNTEGKINFLNEAKRLICLIPSLFLKRELTKTLAHWVEMKAEDLYALLGLGIKPIRPFQQRVQALFEHRPPSLLEQALMILLQRPQFIEKVKHIEAYQSLDQSDSAIFLKLLESLKKNPCLTSAVLLESWRSTPHFKRLEGLANREILISEKDLIVEFEAILEKLVKEQEKKKKKIELENKRKLIS